MTEKGGTQMREWTRITVHQAAKKLGISDQAVRVQMQIGRASCRERV